MGLHNLIGGFILGLGMVIAAGCPFRLLVRTGEGDLSAIVAIFGFLGGIVLFSLAKASLNAIFLPFTLPQVTKVFDLLRFLR